MPYKVKHITEDKEWKGKRWDHEYIGFAIEQKDGIVFGDTIYLFEQQDKLKLCNMDMIRRALSKRVTKCTVSFNLKFHHSNGPF